MLAKKELIQFLKKNKAVAVYFWTIYGCERNSKSVKKTLEEIEFETRPKQLCQLYQDLLGKIVSNPNIKNKKYWERDTLYHLYLRWCNQQRKKFHM